MGDVIGAHCFLKIVTMAVIRPPMVPSSRNGIIAAGFCFARYHGNTAPAITTASRIAVLLTVP